MLGHKLFVLFAFSSAAFFCGCGGGPNDTPELGDVSGTITIDGQPKENLTVSFTPADGRPAMGTTDAEGQYSLQYSMTETGTKVGKNVVRISSPEPPSDDDADLEDLPDFIDPIPAKYNTEAADNPEMNVEVEPGDNTFDFDIDSSAPPNTGPDGEGAPPEICGG